MKTDTIVASYLSDSLSIIEYLLPGGMKRQSQPFSYAKAGIVGLSILWHIRACSLVASAAKMWNR